MSLSVSPLRGLGMKCQFTRSLSLNSNPAVSSCAGERQSRKRLALVAISFDAFSMSGAAVERGASSARAVRVKSKTNAPQRRKDAKKKRYDRTEGLVELMKLVLIIYFALFAPLRQLPCPYNCMQEL